MDLKSFLQLYGYSYLLWQEKTMVTCCCNKVQYSTQNQSGKYKNRMFRLCSL